MADSAYPRRSLRDQLPRMLAEGTLIVLSILLGFVVNEWRLQRSEQELAATAVERFRSEIRHNRASVEERLAYHEGIVARAEAELATPGPEDEPLLAMLERVAPRGILPPDLRDTAWQSALASRALEKMDYDLTFVIATVYRNQAVGADQTWRRIVDEFVRPESFLEGRRLAVLQFLWISSKELVSQEQSLIKLYAWAESVLDGEVDPKDARESIE
ncbi:MAG: hypothetical protein AAGN66_05370 [Acidobacteriota bacterium]